MSCLRSAKPAEAVCKSFIAMLRRKRKKQNKNRNWVLWQFRSTVTVVDFRLCNTIDCQRTQKKPHWLKNNPQNLNMSFLKSLCICVCFSGGHRSNIPAWFSEPTLCSARCSSEGSAGGLLHAGPGETFICSFHLIMSTQVTFIFSEITLMFHYFYYDFHSDRLVLKWMPRTRTWGRLCWRPSSTITLKWRVTWSRTVPASITLWVPVGIKSKMWTCRRFVWISVFAFATLLQEDDGYTGLHHAAKLGNLEIVNMLLETGQVDVNAQVRGEVKTSELLYSIFVCCQSGVNFCRFKIALHAGFLMEIPDKGFYCHSLQGDSLSANKFRLVI